MASLSPGSLSIYPARPPQCNAETSNPSRITGYSREIPSANRVQILLDRLTVRFDREHMARSCQRLALNCIGCEDWEILPTPVRHADCGESDRG